MYYFWNLSYYTFDDFILAKTFAPHLPCDVRALVLTYSRALRAPVLHVPFAIGIFVPHVLCASRALCPMWPHASHFMRPFSLGTLLSCTLCALCSNITFYALEFPCFALLFSCLFATCNFWGVFSKLKTNIVF